MNHSLGEAHVLVPGRNGGARRVKAALALRRSAAEPSLVAVLDSFSSDAGDRAAEEHGFEV